MSRGDHIFGWWSNVNTALATVFQFEGLLYSGVIEHAESQTTGQVDALRKGEKHYQDRLKGGASAPTLLHTTPAPTRPGTLATDFWWKHDGR